MSEISQEAMDILLDQMKTRIDELKDEVAARKSRYRALERGKLMLLDERDEALKLLDAEKARRAEAEGDLVWMTDRVNQEAREVGGIRETTSLSRDEVYRVIREIVDELRKRGEVLPRG